MEINQSIFKSYDIRGIYGSELTKETAFWVGKTLASMTKAKKIVVAMDGRIGSDVLKSELIKGIISLGVDVVDIGLAPTECLYFCVGFYNYDAGVMITASHNPKEYNGFKMIEKKDGKINIIRGRDIVGNMTALLMGIKEENKQFGKVEQKDFWSDYINHILSFVDISKIKPLKIAIDASNGVAGQIISRIKGLLPIEITEINNNIDGSFPDHSPNPLEAGSSEEISKIIKDNKLDFGFIFDGDADRIFLVDESGRLIPADITLLLLAEYLLNKNKGSAIAYNAICSKAVPEFVLKWGGVPIKTKVGFVNVREGMMANNGVMGGELSGHYCFRDNFYLDSGFIALLIILDIASNKPISELISELEIYFKTDVNLEIKDKDKAINLLKEKYADGKIDELDGVTIEYSDWWFNARASQTEPVLRLTIEANTEDVLAEKKKELLDVIL